MARRHKKIRSGPRFARLRSMNWGNVRRGAIALAWLIGIVGVIGAAIYSVPRLEAYASALAADAVVEIEFLDPPAWIEGELRERFVHTAQSQLIGDPMSRTDSDLPAVRDALLNTGWFDEIRQVRRARAGLIVIDAEFVDPYALIRNQEGDHLVDPKGRLLPKTFPQDHAEQFMVITGARFIPPRRPGLEWEGSDVAAALRLLRLIERQPWREQVRMIDVTGQTRGGAIKLVTAPERRSWILWGSAPGEEEPLEALVDRKLQFLTHNYTEFGHIDGNHGGEVDITDHHRMINR